MAMKILRIITDIVIWALVAGILALLCAVCLVRAIWVRIWNGDPFLRTFRDGIRDVLPDRNDLLRWKTVIVLLCLAGSVGATTFECDAPLSSDGSPLAVRYAWIVNGEEIAITDVPTIEIETPVGLTEVQAFALYTVEVEDADGFRTIYVRSEEGTNVARVRVSLWTWLRRLLIR